MPNNNNLDSIPIQKGKKLNSKTKTLIFALQVSFVLILLILWVSSNSLRTSKNLLVLFFYSFPSEFLIAIVPHEPVLLYYGKFYSPLTVTAVAIISTLMTETLNYSVFKYIIDTNIFQRIRHKKTVNKIIILFQKAPFIAIWIAGFTPVPFYPFRLLVVLAHYPVIKYILAVFLSRAPRFFILALAGQALKIPDYLLVTLFVLLVLSLNFAFVKNLLKKKVDASNNSS